MTAKEWNLAVAAVTKAGFKYHSSCNCMARTVKYRKNQWYIRLGRSGGVASLAHRNTTLLSVSIKKVDELIQKVIRAEETNVSY